MTILVFPLLASLWFLTMNVVDLCLNMDGLISFNSNNSLIWIEISSVLRVVITFNYFYIQFWICNFEIGLDLIYFLIFDMVFT